MKVKKILLSSLAGIMSFLSGCGDAAMNKETKVVTEFKWYAVATAPRDYPMEVISGEFIYKGLGYGVSIPSGGTLTQGWGVSTSSYVIGPEFKPLPDRVYVKFYSYTENKFYEADFALPYDNILAKFRQQLEENPQKPYSKFLIGIAPGGAISVWIKGPRSTEVYFGQAKEISMTPSAAFKLPFTSKEDSDEYVASALAESVTPEQLAYIKKHGAPIGTWARFRNLYKWVPVYKEGKPVTDSKMPVDFLNGESHWIPTQFDEELANTPKPLPEHLQFSAQATKDDNPFYRVDFEPFELMEAFEKLGAQGEKVFIEFDPQVPRENMKIRVYNDKEPSNPKTAKEYIELKKIYVKPK